MRTLLVVDAARQLRRVILPHRGRVTCSELDADLRQRLSAPGRLQAYALARCCRAMVSEAGLNAQGVSTFRRMGTSMSDGWRGSSRAQRVRSQEQAASAWQR